MTALAPLEDRIRVHVILCRLALLLVRIVEITRLSRRLSPVGAENRFTSLTSAFSEG